MDGSLITGIHQLYARQSHLIDGGHADAWARTFTPDGEFHSPTYPAPVVGRDRLRAFAEDFAHAAREAGEVRRHVVTNLFVESADTTQAQVSAYLQVIGTRVTGDTAILRFTTVSDRLVRDGQDWRIARRDVRRDDTA
ncbi:nuclear transport factor 2 family protein [Nocardiopsis sp. CNS-639]|uniref:nuclear transport factor 2 family protein n=1 Tax=Nocardiopsis sp. CNS-639 TaxID=1169153 RepID=UPI00036BABCB|nr:nuclear transport factor 2 family protein [Nocardiopsis sp. CNS-639]